MQLLHFWTKKITKITQRGQIVQGEGANQQGGEQARRRKSQEANQPAAKRQKV